MAHPKLPKIKNQFNSLNAGPVMLDNVNERLRQDLNHLKNIIKSIMYSLFDWEVPFECRQWYIEQLLFNKGRCCFASFEGAVSCVPFDYVAEYNIMGQPLFVDCYLYNTNVIRKRITDVVIVPNRQAELPNCIVLNQYASRLQDLNQALDNNLLHTNHPFLIKSWGKNNTLTRFFDKIVSGIPVIAVREDMKNSNDIDVLNTNVAYLGSEILNTYINLRNEMLINLGIPANMTNKTERVTTAETHNDSCLCDLVFHDMLKCRQDAINKINTMFNLNIRLINNRDKVCKKVGDLVNVDKQSL